MWDRTAQIVKVIWVRRERKYFFEWDWTGGIKLVRFDKSAFGENLVAVRIAQPKHKTGQMAFPKWHRPRGFVPPSVRELW
jgi:hypothetical protein